MNKIKGLLIKLLFNKEQREVIWNSLRVVELSYRKEKEIDKAVEVRFIMEKLRGMIGKKTYSPQEVNSTVNDAVNECVADLTEKHNACVEKIVAASNKEISKLRESLHTHAENNTAMGQENEILKRENGILRKKLNKLFCINTKFKDWSRSDIEQFIEANHLEVAYDKDTPDDVFREKVLEILTNNLVNECEGCEAGCECPKKHEESASENKEDASEDEAKK